MALGEFELIRRYFSAAGARRADVTLGVGDDAALLQLPTGTELVACVDTLVAGVHFPKDSPAKSIGHRSLAVNLSDIAAMGATPAWFTLALTLPAADESWLEQFSSGLHSLALAHSVALVGGDTTSGPLSSTVQVLGYVERGRAVRRSGARPGDVVCVSGTLGDAAAGLDSLQGIRSIAGSPERDFLERRFLYPQPRIGLGLALAGHATAAIDISDGLLADLGKLLEASGVGARVDLDRLPLSAALARSVPTASARRLAATGGDDYELCFTVPEDRIEAVSGAAGVAVSAIGVVQAGTGWRCFEDGRPVEIESQGFDHFLR